VLPACREDEGTGKCRLSVGIMRAMGLSLAAPLLLRTPDHKVRPGFPSLLGRSCPALRLSA
jgi:hypothetical protein